jgi:hypothetical protein
MRPALALVLLAGCSATPRPRPYPAPEARALVEHIRAIHDRASSLNADTKTDVRLGDQRVNVNVLMLATWGGKLRFQAHDPNQATAADLASDGARYCRVDYHANCSECGPATPENVARLVRIPLEPDEVIAVLLGAAPLLDGEATNAWDPEGGHERLTLRRGDAIENLVLDDKWDVLEAQLSSGGRTVWSLKHKDFHDVATRAGGSVRLPGASLFEQGGDTVRIQWNDQRVGAPLDAKAFQLDVPPGLPACPR